MKQARHTPPRRMAMPVQNAIVGGLAFGLMALLVLQDMYGLEIAPLARLQQGGTWKLATGALLVAFLGFQWTLAALRMRGAKSLGNHLRWHRFTGALGPLFFFLHASRFGYAYLAALSFVFLGNILLGAAAPLLQRLPVKKHVAAKLVVSGWPIAHVAASVLTVVLTAVHAVLAAWYE